MARRHQRCPHCRQKPTINDLELAGMILNWLAAEYNIPDMENLHIGSFCYNTSTVSWVYKLRTSKSIPAACLLRMLKLRIHTRKSSPLIRLSIAGDKNKMTDIILRAFKTGKFAHAGKNLNSYFNTHFPIPKKRSWKEFKLDQKLISLVMCCLRGELLEMVSLLRLPKRGKSTGAIGRSTQQCGTSPLTWNASILYNKTSFPRPLLQGSGQVHSVSELKSEFKQSRTRLQPLARPLSWLVNPTPATVHTTSTRWEDPPSVPQLAVPISVPKASFTAGIDSSDPWLQHIGCLVLVAFYYLLRVGEYTMPKYTMIDSVRKQATRTKQFLVGNVGSFKNSTIFQGPHH